MDELRDVVFRTSDDKAPGPDGFNARFFKAAWDIVQTDVLNAVISFMKDVG